MSRLGIAIVLMSLLIVSCGEKSPPPKQEQAKPTMEVKEPPQEVHDTSGVVNDKEMEKPVLPKEEPQPSGVPKEVTLHGELVDLVSYITWASQTPESIRKSAQAGNPIGFYDTANKKLYVVGRPQMNVAANELLLPYVGLRVFLKGKAYAKGKLNLLLMTDIGKSIK